MPRHPNPTKLISYDPKVKYTPAEIKAIRRRLGVSFDQMGKITGVHRLTISAWETGGRSPSQPNMILLRLIDLYPELFIDKPKPAKSR